MLPDEVPNISEDFTVDQKLNEFTSKVISACLEESGLAAWISEATFTFALDSSALSVSDSTFDALLLSEICLSSGFLTVRADLSL